MTPYRKGRLTEPRRSLDWHAVTARVAAVALLAGVIFVTAWGWCTIGEDAGPTAKLVRTILVGTSATMGVCVVLYVVVVAVDAVVTGLKRSVWRDGE